MGFIAPFIPAIIGAGGAIGSALIGKRGSDKRVEAATTLTPEEQQAQTAVSGAAGTLGEMGSELFGQGVGALGQATSYYETLLGRGGRGAMQAAVAPAAENIADIYSGAERGLEEKYIRGGVRDQAIAELDREKAGRIARLTAGVQPAAASALAGIGGQSTGAGIAGAAGAGSLYAALLGSGDERRRLGLQAGIYGDQQAGQLGTSLGGILFDIIGNKGGGEGTIPGIPAGAPPSFFGPDQAGAGLYRQ